LSLGRWSRVLHGQPKAGVVPPRGEAPPARVSKELREARDPQHRRDGQPTRLSIWPAWSSTHCRATLSSSWLSTSACFCISAIPSTEMRRSTDSVACSCRSLLTACWSSQPGAEDSDQGRRPRPSPSPADQAARRQGLRRAPRPSLPAPARDHRTDWAHRPRLQRPSRPSPAGRRTHPGVDCCPTKRLAPRYDRTATIITSLARLAVILSCARRLTAH
jgi:hypothetical protein